MSTLELNLEVEKMALIREIANVNSTSAIKLLKELWERAKVASIVLSKEESETLTHRMLAKYAGKWEDDREADDIIEDIYSARCSRVDNHISPFDL